MMLRTATVQVNLDFADEADAAAKMRCLYSVTSILTALWAARRSSTSRSSGYQSYRAWIWRDTDNARAGLLPFVFERDDVFRAYTEWALDVPMYFVYRGGYQRGPGRLDVPPVHARGLERRARDARRLGAAPVDAVPRGPAQEVHRGPRLRLRLAADDRRARADDARPALRPDGAHRGDRADRGAVVRRAPAARRRRAARRASRRAPASTRSASSPSELVAIARDGLSRVAPATLPLLAPVEEIAETRRTQADAMLALWRATPATAPRWSAPSRTPSSPGPRPAPAEVRIVPVQRRAGALGCCRVEGPGESRPLPTTLPGEESAEGLSAGESIGRFLVLDQARAGRDGRRVLPRTIPTSIARWRSSCCAATARWAGERGTRPADGARPRRWRGCRIRTSSPCTSLAFSRDARVPRDGATSPGRRSARWLAAARAVVAPRCSRCSSAPARASPPRTARASCTATSSPTTCWSISDGRARVVDFGLAAIARPTMLTAVGAAGCPWSARRRTWRPSSCAASRATRAPISSRTASRCGRRCTAADRSPATTARRARSAIAAGRRCEPDRNARRTGCAPR